jgi:DnaJ family protein A protein 2
LCEGTGSKSKKLLKCGTCHGSGRFTQIRQMGPMRQVIQGACPACKGKGKSIKLNDMCGKCKGKTVVKSENILKIEIIKGIKHGDAIVFREESDQEPEMIAGDIIVRIKEKKHPYFIRKGYNLILKKTISLRDSLCGCNFTIKLLDNSEILVKTEKGEIIKPSQFKKLPNYGMPKEDGSSGDMYIKFRIIFPNKIEKKIITKLEKILISSSSNKNIENSDALLVEMDNISSSEVKQILEGSNYANDEEEDVYDQEGCPIQ